MKKSLIFALTALLAVSFTFFSCKPNEDEPKDDTTTEQPSGEDKGDTGNETDKPSEDNPSTDDPKEDVKADKVIWENADGKEFTSNAYNVYLNLDENINLDGYKYLNVEFSATENVSGQNVIVQPMSGKSGAGHPQGNILVSGAVSKETRQTKFGTTFGKYSAWENGKSTEVKIEDNLLGSLQLYVQETTNWGTVDDVKITVYKVTATNTELK